MSASCSNTGPRAHFNKFVRKVIGDLGIDGTDVLQLVIMLRQRNSREDLVFCMQNKAPCMHLSKSSFSSLVDVLRALLREANNSGDHSSVSAAFRVSQLYGRTLGTFEHTILASLSSHEVWRSEIYWLQATDALLSQDIFRWQALSSTSRKGVFGANFKDAQVYSFFAINRIQAVAFGSMRRMGVSLALIATYLEACQRNYGLTAANIDITQRPHESVVMGLLDMGIEQSIFPSDREAKMIKSFSTQESLGSGLGRDSGQSNRLTAFSDEEGSFTVINARAKHFKVGFCALLEVIFYLSALADSTSPIAKFLSKVKALRAAEVEKNLSDRSKMQQYELKCMCGMPLNAWKPLGIFDTRLRHRRHLNHFVCELCFRHCTSPLGSLGSVIAGGVGSCAVPSCKAERAQSFLCLFYGNTPARHGFQNTSGQHVRLHALGNFSSVNVTFKKRGKHTKRTVSMSSPSRQQSISSDGLFDTESDESDRDTLPSAGSECLESMDSEGDSGSESSRDVFSDSYRQHGDAMSRSGSKKFGRNTVLGEFVVLMQAGVDVVKITASPFTRHLPRTLFLDSRAQDLCWLPPGRGDLTVVAKSSIPVATITAIKVGTGKMDQCISIVSDTRTLVIKVEDSKHFRQILEGFMALTEDNRAKKSTVGRQEVVL